MWSELLFFYIFGLLISFVTLNLSVEIEAGDKQCFFQPISAEHKFLDIDYQVINGGNFDVHFSILLNSEILQLHQFKKEGNHRLNLSKPGDYEFCFDNTFSYQTKKRVAFDIFLYDEDGVLLEENISKFVLPHGNELDQFQYNGVKFKQLHESFKKLKNNLNKIEYYQSIASLEAIDRSIIKANHNRVLFWSVINTSILIVVCFLQVFMIKSLFQEKSRFGKLLKR